MQDILPSYPSSSKPAYASFLAKYPTYKDTGALDKLRKDEFSRLEKANEVYVDYMGGCLWPKRLVEEHASLLKSGLFGNTHSDSPCATRSDQQIAAARNAVLEFFDAPSSDYACIFTANATTALKLVGESFPFQQDSRLVIPADCHNSVNGIRNFAKEAGARVDYLESTPYGGFYESDAREILVKHKSESPRGPSLFVLTGQSNVTGMRPNMEILREAKSAGFSTLIDGAALASSTRVSLRKIPAADGMVVSFYKMFGYPTGVGALVAKKSFLATLARTWFSGGTVDFVQAPGNLTLHAKDLTSRFEEGTLNYSSLPAIAPGLRFLHTYMPYMSIRLPILHHYLHTGLESLVYPGTKTPLVQVHSRLRSMPTATRPSTPIDYNHSSERLDAATKSGRSSPYSFKRMFSRHSSPSRAPSPALITPPITNDASRGESQGYVVSCTFYTSQGTMIPFSDVSRLAAVNGISLRTGCVCNPGGSAALRGEEVQQQMKSLSMLDETAELKDIMGGLKNSGVVRLSLGLVSNFDDVWRVLNWARGLLDEAKRDQDLKNLGHAHSH